MPPTLPLEIVIHIFELVEADERRLGWKGSSPFLWTVTSLSHAWRIWGLIKLVRHVYFILDLDGFGSIPQDPEYKASERIFRLVQTLLSTPVVVAEAVRSITLAGSPPDDEQALSLLFMSCTNLEHLVVEEADFRNLDVLPRWTPLVSLQVLDVKQAWATDLVLARLASLVIENSNPSSLITRASLPSLQILALLEVDATSSFALANFPTLRALVTSTDSCPDMSGSSLDGHSILWDITDWDSMPVGDFWDPPQSIIHVRCRAGQQAGEIVTNLEGGSNLFALLRTVYLVPWLGERSEWGASDARLREAGRRRGFNVAYEPQASVGTHNCDYFLHEHGRLK